MFSRKLQALRYVKTDDFDVHSDSDFRPLVVWLEDQVIRHYSIESRASLRDVDSPTWEQVFEEYAKTLGCPYSQRIMATEYLLTIAVGLKYEENIEVYGKITGASILENASRAPQVKPVNPLDNMDFQSEEFKACVKSLAKLLNIQSHPDHLVTLKALCTLIRKNFGKDANKENWHKGGKPFPLDQMPLGFETNDSNFDKAAKILRLCYIHDLRDLQTKINETIVAIQNITANPKTDTRLGKVGF